jgi:B12-binding domain/radical SAM domain protein
MASNDYDLLLLHPPAVFDFRERPLNHWLLSKAVDTNPVFEYYPVGFISHLDHLEERGRNVRLANLAVKMQDKRFDPRRFVRDHSPLLFGIDLHWVQHADGALSLAKLCKEEHSDIPVVLGGHSSTYFWKELIQNPDIDFILRGETTEEPLAQLLDCLEQKQEPTDVPNLIWKRDGVIIDNPFTYRPTLLTTRINYERLFAHWRRTRDLKGSLLTGQHWPVYCANLLLFCKGCVENCAICGGSNWALGLEETPLWDLDVLTDMCIAARKLTKFALRLPGDIRQGDWRGFLGLLKKKKFTGGLHFDIFRPTDHEFCHALADAVPEPHGGFGPVTHDEKLRELYGLPYDNASLERSIEDLISVGGKVDLFFYIGIPGQTFQSARETTDYCIQLLERFSTRGRENSFDAYVCALAPFVDPASLAYTYPDKYGYRMKAGTVADHRALMRQPEWWDTLNYESEAMTRYEFAQAVVEAEARVTQARADLGVGARRQAKRDLKRLEGEMVHLEDSMLAGASGS